MTMKLLVIAFILERRTVANQGNALPGVAQYSPSLRLARTPPRALVAGASRSPDQSPLFWTWFIPNPRPSSDK
jgi:hypothetical protein